MSDAARSALNGLAQRARCGARRGRRLARRSGARRPVAHRSCPCSIAIGRPRGHVSSPASWAPTSPDRCSSPASAAPGSSSSGSLVGVPLAPVAAVWYAVVSLIPQIGGFLGTSFVTILALTQGVVPALIVLVLVVAYMNTENYIITPDDRRQGSRPVSADHDARCSRRRRRRWCAGRAGGDPVDRHGEGAVPGGTLRDLPVDAERSTVRQRLDRLGPRLALRRLARLVRRAPPVETGQRRRHEHGDLSAAGELAGGEGQEDRHDHGAPDQRPHREPGGAVAELGLTALAEHQAPAPTRPSP